jgi:MarR family transcriptional regulator, organic hydroperoxide resistance regulator
MNDADVRAVQRYYPQIYFACHAEHVRKRSTPYALSSHDSAVLSHLSETEPRTAGALVRHLGITASTFSPQLERLVALGYAERTRAGSDRRHWEIRLTPKGAKAMAATSVLDAARVKRVLSQLTPARRARAVEGLSLLAEASRQTGRGR